MATSLTTVTGRLLDPAGQPVVNEYVYFYLRQAGADNDITPNEVYSRGDRVEAQTDSSGDISVDLWVNGDSDILSLLLIETKTGKIDPTLVIIPTVASGGTIDIAELLINHVASGSNTQQSSVLDEAKQYTDQELDALAADPRVSSSFDADVWIDDALRAYRAVQIDDMFDDPVNSLFFDVANWQTALGVETTVTDDDTKIPTSGAVVDYNASRTGFVDYNDTTGSITITADTWTDVPNNTLGAFTNTTYKPTGITTLIDDTTGYLDFTELSLGAEIAVRNDFTVNPDTNNSLLQARYLLGNGAGEYALLFSSERLDSGSGIDYQRVTTFPIYMGDANTRDNPGKLQIKLSTTGTLTNAGSYISIKNA